MADRKLPLDTGFGDEPADNDPHSVTVSDGEIAIIMRRMAALKISIDQRKVTGIEFCFDQVHRALTKSFGLPR